MNLEELKKKDTSGANFTQAEKLSSRKSKHIKKTRDFICYIKKTCSEKNEQITGGGTA